MSFNAMGIFDKLQQREQQRASEGNGGSFGNKNIYGTQITEDLTIQKIWDHGLPFKTFRNVLLENPMSCPYEL